MAVGWTVDLDRPGQAAAAAQESADDVAAEFFDGDLPADPDQATRDLLAALARAAAADDRVASAFQDVEAEAGAGVFALCFPGIDGVSHRCLRYARPEDFGNVTDREIERFGQVLERYYVRVDSFVNRALRARGEEGLLLVTSAHGMDPAPLWRRMAAAGFGAAAESGTHGNAPAGFLFMLGPGVRQGGTFGRASIADVVPTVLYALNLPIARDLDGGIVEQALTPGFTLEHPAVVIESYGWPIRPIAP
jgi:hypothetical protein